MRDSRLGDLIGYCDKFLTEFIQSESELDRLGWMPIAIREWQEACELPPGCKAIQFDSWLSSPLQRNQLAHFFAFVAKKIRTTMPATEAIMADEAERVQKFIVESGAQTIVGVPPKDE